MKFVTQCRHIIVYLLVAAASACAVPPKTPTVQDEATQTGAAAQTKPSETRPSAPRPKIELTQDTLYKLLVAELAGQRGQLDISVENYLELAEETRDPQIAERATRIAIYAKKDKETLRAATLWRELAPQHPDARLALATVYIRANKMDAAIEELEFVLQSQPEDDGQQLRVIANLIGRSTDKDTGLAIMQKLVASRRNNPDALFAYALTAIRADKYDEARTAMEKVLDLAPTNTNAAMAYLSILQKQNNLEGALGWLDKAVATNPEVFDLRMIYARLLADTRRFDEARKQFEILNEKDPENADIQYALGLLNLQAERLDEARKNFSTLVADGNRVNEASFHLGQIAETEKDYAEALRWYRAVDSGDYHLDAQLKVAYVLNEQKKLEQALKHLDTLKFEHPEQRKQVIRVKGELLTKAERFREAMTLYDTAIAEGYDADLLYTRAILAEKMNKLDTLERDLRTILEKEPDNAQVLNALGYTLADRTDRYEEAYKLIKKALQINPTDFYILDSMGWVLYRLGRLEESVEYLHKAKAIKEDPEVAAHLAEVLWMMGDRDGARSVWENALKETPGDEKLLDVIKRLSP